MPSPFFFLDRILHWGGDISSLPADVSLFLPPSSGDTGGRARVTGTYTAWMLHVRTCFCQSAGAVAGHHGVALRTGLGQQDGSVLVLLSRGRPGDLFMPKDSGDGASPRCTPDHLDRMEQVGGATPAAAALRGCGQRTHLPWAHFPSLKGREEVCVQSSSCSCTDADTLLASSALVASPVFGGAFPQLPLWTTGPRADGRQCQPLTTSPRPGNWWSSSASKPGSSESRSPKPRRNS
ncbi:G protein subunit gamma 7 [Phyllostomus discolor]|uniref:G protein subunit gamma 7 n=1 Tax=Phyllostomus discolor TaxID=89673 RepID=A0A833ZMD7_9CHIR|nr:G protein subunit gamma 7 [Phyllostomus discolor]